MEERLEKKRLAEKLRYQRIKNDAQKYAVQKEKHKQKYLRKNLNGGRNDRGFKTQNPETPAPKPKWLRMEKREPQIIATSSDVEIPNIPAEQEILNESYTTPNETLESSINEVINTPEKRNHVESSMSENLGSPSREYILAQTSTPKSKPKRFRMEQLQLQNTPASSNAETSNIPVTQETLDDSYTSPNATLESSLDEAMNAPEDRNHIRSFMSENLGSLSREYIQALITDRKNQMDTVYGPHFNADKLVIGNSAFNVDREDNILINDVRFKGSRGLFELIFKRLPDDQLYSDADLKTYGRILRATLAYNCGYLASKPIYGNQGSKYKYIISKLIPAYDSEVKHRDMIVDDDTVDYESWNDPKYKHIISKLIPTYDSEVKHHDMIADDDTVDYRNDPKYKHIISKLIPTYDSEVKRHDMIADDDTVDYIYWDNPNELVERLRLLIASQEAGHTGHNDEIASIIEELREAGTLE